MIHRTSAANQKAATDHKVIDIRWPSGQGSLKVFKAPHASDSTAYRAGEDLAVSDPKDLMEAVREGDREAFEELVEILWAGTIRYAVHLTGDQDQANDVVQVAFIRLWESRASLSSAGSVQVWLQRTARNLIVNEHRRKNVSAKWVTREGKEDRAPPRTPLEETERQELRAAIWQAVKRLSPRRRESFTLCHIQGLSYREAAEVMKIRPQSVANYLQAALADLRIDLAPFYRKRPSGDAGSSGSNGNGWTFRRDAGGG